MGYISYTQLLLLLTAAPIAFGCDWTKFEACVARLATDLPPSSGNLKSVFVDYFGHLYQLGKPGLVKACPALQRFDQCGSDTLPECITTGYLVSQRHLPYWTAVAINNIYIYNDYKCSNTDVFIGKYECIAMAKEQHATELKACVTVWHQQQHDHPNRKCQSTQTYINCKAAVFTNACGPLVGKAICHLNVVGLQTNFMPSCHFTCQ